MSDSLLTRYILDGGWTIALLLPAAVVAVATALRAAWLLRRTNLVHVADSLSRQTAGTSRADATAASYEAALRLYALLQPLSALFVLATLVGLLGSFSALLGMPAPIQPDHFRQALLPPIWGLGISIFSYAAFVILRARVYAAERDILLPAATATAAARSPQ